MAVTCGDARAARALLQASADGSALEVASLRRRYCEHAAGVTAARQAVHARLEDDNAAAVVLSYLPRVGSTTPSGRQRPEPPAAGTRARFPVNLEIPM